ncbi:MAG: hypothetical protein ACRDA5_07880 [Clostridium sp.]
MGSKKTRNRELKQSKQQEIETAKNEIDEKNKKRKGAALMNMAALFSIIVIIYMGNLMTNTVDPQPNLKSSTNLIEKKLHLENAEAISSIFAGDAAYVLYRQNDELGLIQGNPNKFLQNRFHLDTDLKLIPNGKKVATYTHRYEHKNQDRVIVYGDLTATKAKYAEVTYNNKTEKMEFEASAPFMQIIEFDAVDGETPSVKIFDTDNNDITKELMN